MEIVEQARTLTDFMEYNLSLQSTNSRKMDICSWQPPPEGMVKINFDGATFAETNSVEAGAIARLSDGSCIRWRQQHLSFKAAPNHAELLAAAIVVRFGIDMGWNHVIVERDCLSVISKLSSEEPDSSVLGNLLQDIRNHTKTFIFCKFNHVPRDANIAAHKIARGAFSDLDGEDMSV
ncbi:hypothetical protein Salat_1178200 [Sesamum alatum]|uniref:RNase H type-1 domain-containing protein n=1 Tax=Sesamum alatum TaxID=300844 RepID=A0AAE1YEV4_9LAMI|nr:hypothetical protein Salat_1178200 [Sesamum alatum]